MTKRTRKIGICRPWKPGHPEARQLDALRSAGADPILTIPDECPTWRDAIRVVRRGDVVLIQFLQLIAEPKSAKVRHPAMDMRDAIEAIEGRGASLTEVGTGRSTADVKQRAAMIADAAKSLGAGGRSLSSEQARANGAAAGDRRGRPKASFTKAEVEAARRVWESRKVATWQDAASLLPKGFTVYRAAKLFGPRERKTKR